MKEDKMTNPQVNEVPIAHLLRISAIGHQMAYKVRTHLESLGDSTDLSDEYYDLEVGFACIHADIDNPEERVRVLAERLDTLGVPSSFSLPYEDLFTSSVYSVDGTSRLLKGLGLY